MAEREGLASAMAEVVEKASVETPAPMLAFCVAAVRAPGDAAALEAAPIDVTPVGDLAVDAAEWDAVVAEVGVMEGAFDASDDGEEMGMMLRGVRWDCRELD
jgi:hypothetical protein